MKKDEAETNDELRSEYDLRRLRVRRVGPGRQGFGELVRLAPDVAEAFPTAEAVNEALRSVIKAATEREAPRSG